MLLRVLAVGDIVGEGGQDILSRRLHELKEDLDIHFAVVNGENASGVGITPRQARNILDAGADVITLGNHTWNRIQIGEFLDKNDRILRPANYSGRVPGRGMGIDQRAVYVKDGDTPEVLQRRVMEEAEWVILPRAIDLIANGRVHVENGKVMIDGGDR